MFRKPKAKKVQNQRQREVSESDDGPPAPIVSTVPEVILDDSDNEDIKVLIEKPKKTALLSFDDEGDNDVEAFQIKKPSHKKRAEKMAKRLKELEAADATKKQRDAEIIVLGEKTVKPKSEVVTDPVILADFQEDHETRARFAGMEDIPDAQTIFEAKKRRNEMRRDGTKQKLQNNGAEDGFIPLSDLSLTKNVRERLVREDDNDMSDEDTENPSGQFYSKSLLVSEEERRRQEQMDMMYGDESDESVEDKEEEDAEAARRKAENDEDVELWEKTLMKKGVSNHLVKQMRADNCATNNEQLPEENDGEDDMDVEVIGDELPPMVKAANLPMASNVNLNSIIEKLRIQMEDTQNNIAYQEHDIARKEDTIAENEKDISELEALQPTLVKRNQMLEELNLYIRDLFDCISDKYDTIQELEDHVMEMWKTRAKKLQLRRHGDIKDEYLRCKALASGRPWHPLPETQINELYRQNRRSYRRIQREKAGIIDQNDGLSSDEDEPESDLYKYQQTTTESLETATNLFSDAAEEFGDIGAIINRFSDWLILDNKTFDNTHILNALPKILIPFIRLEMLTWNPLKDAQRPLHSFNWYKQLLCVGTEKIETDVGESSIVWLIPKIIEKHFMKVLLKIVEEQWDPFSLSQTRNLVDVLSSFVEESFYVNLDSAFVNPLISMIIKKFTAICEEDAFIPLFGKADLANTASGSPDFLNRRFWSFVKLLRSANLLSKILSQKGHQTLLFECLICRYGVFALQLSPKDSIITIERAIAIINEIPVEWLPPSDMTPYCSLINVLKAIVSEAPATEATRKIQNFVSLVQS